MPVSCKQLKHSIDEFLSFKSEFISEYERVRQTGDLHKAKQLKQETEQKYVALIEYSYELSFETLLPLTELRKQYTDQKDTFQKKTSEGRSILNRLKNGELGIAKEDTVNGEEYRFPPFTEVLKQMMRERNKFKTKLAQGFKDLQFTPFAMKLETLAKITGQTILDHKAQNHLFATKKNQDDPTEVLVPLDLDTSKPLFVWDGWINPNVPEGQRGADVTGDCVYYPTQLTKEGHGGLTKIQKLEEQKRENPAFAGWFIDFFETNPNIPRQGINEIIGNRKRLETNQTPIQYLEILQNAQKQSDTVSPYNGERVLTNEHWFARFLSYLEKTNQVIDDWEGNGCVCYLLGSFHHASGYLGRGFWDRSDGQAYVGGRVPWFHTRDAGLRSAVGFGT